jgi:hypothetical protein
MPGMAGIGDWAEAVRAAATTAQAIMRRIAVLAMQMNLPFWRRSRMPVSPAPGPPTQFPQLRWKSVKLFAYGTKVLFLIQLGFWAVFIENIWRVFRLDLVF